jgi:hypothetical protein
MAGEYGTVLVGNDWAREPDMLNTAGDLTNLLLGVRVDVRRMRTQLRDRELGDLSDWHLWLP